ncbi:TonB-dependent hemoglobin/transferrin/lactoferrin family receptor [Pseudoalteromonas luteoviolacea]|uniref:TonB-dependent hemoglobin/transferrin/lactoferrin family receptor n=1 Tax=Pseudoalteromonas luteoviolacea TaxID=43657 RepID=UPI001B36189A|nr:TonB-dependent hemoglobin/transferrin/lactoferrin family receptor [Pseudoalteromonas luteoviolacea]MBQ4812321.1 TonB-dependent hemoglobin/transferrin/lactoferrin family receptor [Pseudoalteromonas luteoviolacea]
MFKQTTISLSIAAAFFAAPSSVAEQFEKDSEVIVVSGSRIEQKLEDVAGSVNVVTEQEIERELAVDLNSAFKYQTGITTTGSTGEAQALNIRGIGGNRVVYIKDGRRSNDAYASGSGSLIVGRGYLDVDNVKQIEVAKGAASSLYGSDALGGIIVITTKNPSDYLAGENTFAQVGLGFNGVSDETSLSGTFAAQLSDNNASSIQITRRDGDEVQNFIESLDSYEYTSNAAIIKSEFTLSETSSLLATIDYFEQEYDQVITEGTFETVDNNENVSFSLQFETSASTVLYDNLNAQLYLSDFDQQSDQIRMGFTGTSVSHNDYGFEQSIFGTRLVLDKQLQTGDIAHQIVYGIDYDSYETARPRVSTVKDLQGNIIKADVFKPTFPGADTTMLGIFLQDNITLVPDVLTLNAGLRFDKYDMKAKHDDLYQGSEFGDYSESALSPKLGLIYSFNDNLNLVAQYARGFKIPPHDLAYQSHGVPTRYQIIPNADLESETSDSFEFGMKGHFEDKQFSATFFQSVIDDFIGTNVVRMEPGPTPTSRPVPIMQYQNVAEVEFKGFETNLMVWLNDNISIDTGLTYVQGKNKETNQYEPSISPLNGFIKARYEADNWSVTAAFKAAKRMTKVPDEKRVTTSGWGTVDVFADYDLGNWKLNAGIFNLLDKEYTPYESVAGLSRSTTNLADYTQPGRYLAASARFTF